MPQTTQDYWALWLEDEGCRLPCNNARTFLAYLASPSLGCATFQGGSVPFAFADMMLAGPVADNGVRFTVSYRLYRKEIWGEGWTEYDREELAAALRKAWENSDPNFVKARTISDVLGIPVEPASG